MSVTVLYSIRRFFMKLFRTSHIETVHYCQTVFGCELPSVLLVTRYDKFIKNLACTTETTDSAIQTKRCSKKLQQYGVVHGIH